MTRPLRILQVLAASTNDAVSANSVWERNLHAPLVEMGHDVVLVPADDVRVALKNGDAQAGARFSEALLARFRREHARRPFDLVFAYLIDGMVEPGVILGLSPHFDFNLHSERDVGDKFRRIGATPLWWPMASNPAYAHPVEVDHRTGVSFVGGNYGLRAAYALHLLKSGVDLHLYGPGWMRRGRAKRLKRVVRRDVALGSALVSLSLERQAMYSAQAASMDISRVLVSRYPGNLHLPVSDDDVIGLYSQSRVSLGFLEVFDRHDPSQPVLQHLHLREFEAPMSGALYLTNYSEELAEMFEPDKEVLVWRNPHELLEKAQFFCAHPEAGEVVRAAGMRRALRCHTYTRRFEQLFDAVGLQ